MKAFRTKPVQPKVKLPQFHSQPAITCSKLTTETLEQDMKYV